MTLQNNTGSNNTYLGSAARGAAAVAFASAIGSGAIVNNSRHIIVGMNDNRIGIGLSNDAAGPENNLEIRATDFATGATIPVAPGASGLRFRQLTSLSTPQPNPGTGVLSVALNGDVVYVPDQGGMLYAYQNKIAALEARITQLENKLVALLANKN